MPQLEVRLRPEAAARFGLTAGRRPPRGDHAASRGRRSARSTTGQKIFDVVVWGVPSRSATTSRSVRDAADRDARWARRCRSGDVADVAIVPAPNEIKREGASRRIDVTCNVKGRDLGARRPRDRGEGASELAVRPRVPPRVPRRVRGPRRSRRRRLLRPGRAVAARASC